MKAGLFHAMAIPVRFPKPMLGDREAVVVKVKRLRRRFMAVRDMQARPY